MTWARRTTGNATPLHVVAARPRVHVVAPLLDRGADERATDGGGATPLGAVGRVAGEDWWLIGKVRVLEGSAA